MPRVSSIEFLHPSTISLLHILRPNRRRSIVMNEVARNENPGEELPRVELSTPPVLRQR